MTTRSILTLSGILAVTLPQELDPIDADSFSLDRITRSLMLEDLSSQIKQANRSTPRPPRNTGRNTPQITKRDLRKRRATNMSTTYSGPSATSTTVSNTPSSPSMAKPDQRSTPADQRSTPAEHRQFYFEMLTKECGFSSKDATDFLNSLENGVCDYPEFQNRIKLLGDLRSDFSLPGNKIVKFAVEDRSLFELTNTKFRRHLDHIVAFRKKTLDTASVNDKRADASKDLNFRSLLPSNIDQTKERISQKYGVTNS